VIRQQGLLRPSNQSWWLPSNWTSSPETGLGCPPAAVFAAFLSPFPKPGGQQRAPQRAHADFQAVALQKRFPRQRRAEVAVFLPVQFYRLCHACLVGSVV